MSEKIITGLDHPAIAASDPQMLARWYADVLDYEIVFEKQGRLFLLKAGDGTFIEIMPKDETPRPERTTWTPGAVRSGIFQTPKETWSR